MALGPPLQKSWFYMVTVRAHGTMSTLPEERSGDYPEIPELGGIVIYGCTLNWCRVGFRVYGRKSTLTVLQVCVLSEPNERDVSLQSLSDVNFVIEVIKRKYCNCNLTFT